MTKNITTLTLLLALSVSVSCGQSLKPTVADKFIDHFNNYQVDSLKNLLADNFQLILSYPTDTIKKKSFLEWYLPNAKKYNGRFEILKISYNEKFADLLVEDRSDYVKYLSITYPKLKLQIRINRQKKIDCVFIDTTEHHQAFEAQWKEKHKQFREWLTLKYPKEWDKDFSINSELMIRRLKEYAAK